MKQKPAEEMYYGVKVAVNPTTEPLRPEECLCLNCAKLKPGEKSNCPFAQSLYEICVAGNIALMVTRCLAWKPKK